MIWSSAWKVSHNPCWFLHLKGPTISGIHAHSPSSGPNSTHSMQSFSFFSKQKYSVSTESASGWIWETQNRQMPRAECTTPFHTRNLSSCKFWCEERFNLPQKLRDNSLHCLCSQIPSMLIYTSNPSPVFMWSVKVAQLCPILCDPRDYTVHGILQAEYWSGQPFPSPGDLPNPGIEPRFPALQTDSLPAEPQGKPSSFIATAIIINQQFTIIDNIFPVRLSMGPFK